MRVLMLADSPNSSNNTKQYRPSSELSKDMLENPQQVTVWE